MGKAKLEIRELIKGDLKTKIERVWQIGEKEYHPFQESKDSSHQGTVHCETVERNLGWLIPDEEKHEIGQFGLFVLSAAACLHDVGKVPLEYVMHDDHGRESMRRIVDNPKDFGLDDGEALAVGWVVSAHNDGKLNKLPEKVSISGEDVPVREFAAIFKLADMLDTNYERVPDSVLKMRYPDGNIPPKLTARKAITGWDIDSQNHIILKAYPKDEIGEETAYTACTLMNEEISSVATTLCLLRYPAEFKLNINPYRIEQGLITESRKDRAFLGMASFTEADASRFRGRGADTQELLGYVTTYPITRLVGESGVGKTSLIQAGLFPKLNGWGWKYVWTRQFDDPAASIGRMVANALLPPGRMAADTSLIDTLRAVSAEHPGKKVLVAIDQFEDVLDSTDGELANILRSLLAIQTGTIIPNLKVLIAFRGDLRVELDKRMFKDVVGSACVLPSVGIVSLDRKGAEDAFIAGFKAAGVGLDATPDEQNGKSLMGIVLDDIEEIRFYPPYIQMVGETLCKHADEYGIVTREAYLKLGGVKQIIAEYLFNLLDKFGEHKEDARKILTTLVTSKGTKKFRTIRDITNETGIVYAQVQSLLDDMVDMRMVRSLGGGEYEIIHDYFGEMVSKELMDPVDKEIKTVLEQLEHAVDAFYHRGVLIDPSLMFQAYLLRGRLLNYIRSNKNVWNALLVAQLSGNGPAWFWLKDINTNELLPVVFELCEHRHAEIRANAVEMIRGAYISGSVTSKNLSFIRKTMLKDSDKYVRQAAFEVLRLLISNNPQFVSEMLEDDDSSVRIAALEVIKEIGSSEDLPILTEVLKDDNSSVRIAALKVLKEIGSSEDIPLLIGMLKDCDSRVREAALNAIEPLLIRGDISLIRKRLKVYDHDVIALDALKKLGNHDDLPLLRKVLGTGCGDIDLHDVCDTAAETFKALVGREDISLVQDMLQSTFCWYERQVAIEVFKKIANRDDIPFIREMLNMRHPEVKIAALEIIKELGSGEDIPFIREMLNEADGEVKIAALEILKKIGSSDDVPLIIKMLKDNDGTVRKALLDVIKVLGTEDDLDLFAENAPIVIALDKRLYCPYTPSKIS